MDLYRLNKTPTARASSTTVVFFHVSFTESALPAARRAPYLHSFSRYNLTVSKDVTRWNRWDNHWKETSRGCSFAITLSNTYLFVCVVVDSNHYFPSPNDAIQGYLYWRFHFSILPRRNCIRLPHSGVSASQRWNRDCPFRALSSSTAILSAEPGRCPVGCPSEERP